MVLTAPLWRRKFNFSPRKILSRGILMWKEKDAGASKSLSEGTVKGSPTR